MAGAEGTGQPAARTHFDVVLRGYNQRQVLERVNRLELDLKKTTGALETALAQVAELTAQLGATRGELADARQRVERLVNTPVNASNVTDRVRVMMTLAEEEIADIRQAALDAAQQTRADADRHSSEGRAAHQRAMADLEDRRRHLEGVHQQHMAELDRAFAERRAELEQSVEEQRASLGAEQETVLTDARTERERVVAEYDKKSADLEKRRGDLEKKYKGYHDDLDKEYDELRTALRKEHEVHVVEAKASAVKLVDQARADAAALTAETARTIAELESDALAKAEKAVADANALAEKTITEADGHADRRIAAADQRLTELRTVRKSLAEQFAQVQEAVTKAVASLAPLEDEDEQTTRQLPKPGA